MAIVEVRARRGFGWNSWRHSWEDRWADKWDLIEIHVLTDCGSFCRDENCGPCKYAKATVLVQGLKGLVPQIEVHDEVWASRGGIPYGWLPCNGQSFSSLKTAALDAQIVLQMYNDQFSAYINGQRVFSSVEPGAPLHYSLLNLWLEMIHRPAETWPYDVALSPEVPTPSSAARSPPPHEHETARREEGSLAGAFFMSMHRSAEATAWLGGSSRPGGHIREPCWATAPSRPSPPSRRSRAPSWSGCASPHRGS